MQDAYELAITDDTGEASASDPLSDHQMHEMAEDKLEALGESLATRRDAWVAARTASGVERRWLADIHQYNGRDDTTEASASMMDAVERGFPVTNQKSKPQRSTVFVNITRPKSNAAEARVANMLCPVDDRNWGLKTAPDPKLVRQAKEQAQALAAANAQAQNPPAASASQPGVAPAPAQPQGTPTAAPASPQPAQPATPNGQAAQPAPQSGGIVQDLQGPYPGPNAQAMLDEADRSCKAMQDEIDDQLIECDYLGQQRAMLHDCAMIGVGVLKGPIMVKRVRKAWQPVPNSNPPIHTLEIVEDIQPASERVDPWNIFPDPSCGEDVRNGRGIYEKKNLSSKQLRDLAKEPGYLKEQIAACLEEGPQTAISNTRHDAENRIKGGNIEVDKDQYEVWEYWGEFTPEDMRTAGVDVPDGETETISGVIVLVNKRVIKGYLNPIETGDIPYDVMVWEREDGSWAGYGMPHLLNSPQRVLNAAWRQLMDNAGCSVGPQLVVDPAGISPVDGRWEITGRKIWTKNDSSIPIDSVFSMTDIPSNIEDISAIIKMAQEFADDTSSTPQLMEGEKGLAPDTVGGMTLLMNASNVVLGRMVKQFDDNVTRPHIRRYYDWNMAYNEKSEIKGDFQVDARGSSALLVRDMAHQTLLGLGQYIANGTIAPMVNWENWFKEILKISHVDPTDIMKTEAEIAKIAAQPASPSPDQIKAQALLQKTQMEITSQEKLAMNKSQIDQQAEQAKAQREEQYAKIEQQTSMSDNQTALQEIQMRHEAETRQLAMAHAQEQTLLAAKLASERDKQNKEMIHQSLLQVHSTNANHIESNADRERDSLAPAIPSQ